MKKTILVTGATGKQGFAVANTLANAGFKVKAFAPEKSFSKEIRTIYDALKVEICTGDFEDISSLRTAISAIYGIFSVLQNDFYHTDSERRHAHTLFTLAKEANVTQIVHTSVSQTGNHNSFRELLTDEDELKYWTDKDDVEKELRAADFPIWTIFRPASLMENYRPPMLQQLHPFLKDERLVTVYDLNKKFQLVTVEDIARFVTAAFNNPDEFNRKQISLASDEITMEQVASALNEGLDKNIHVEYLSYDEAIAAGMSKRLIQSQLWGNQVGYNADFKELNTYQIPLTSFKKWVMNNKVKILSQL